jgi:hypothetical protein
MNFEANQVQYFVMNNFPEEKWFITKPSKETLVGGLKDYIDASPEE